MKKIVIFFLAIASVLNITEALAESKLTPLSQKRIDEIKSILPHNTKGYADRIENREVWDVLAKSQSGQSVIRAAEGISKTSFPEWNDSLMIQYLETGIRKDADQMCGARTKRLMPLVIAECLENKGRFVEAIEYTISE